VGRPPPGTPGTPGEDAEADGEAGAEVAGVVAGPVPGPPAPEGLVEAHPASAAVSSAPNATA
jgi:hypothetical protein